MDGRVVLVTGGARGIGLGIVKAFSAAGCKVMIADLSAGENWKYDLSSKNDMKEAKTSAEKLGGEIACCELDVTDKSSCAKAVAETVDRFGGIDVLINNAGVVQSGPILEVSEEDWDRVFAVNTKGIFLMTQAAIPALAKSSNSAIVNTASVAGKKGHPNMTAYCASKFAAIGITQSLAAELAPQGIRVNAICPGVVGTAMWLDHLMETGKLSKGQSNSDDKKTQDFEQAMTSIIPLGRSQTVEDMGEATLYLASAKNVTGVSLSVAGGLEMN